MDRRVSVGRPPNPPNRWRSPLRERDIFMRDSSPAVRPSRPHYAEGAMVDSTSSGTDRADSPRPDHRLCRRRPARGRVRVVCQKGAMGLGVNLAVALLDVSESGARLILSGPLQRGQEVSLTLEVGRAHV